MHLSNCSIVSIIYHNKSYEMLTIKFIQHWLKILSTFLWNLAILYIEIFIGYGIGRSPNVALKVVLVDTPILTFGAIPWYMLTIYFNIYFDCGPGRSPPNYINTFKIFRTTHGEISWSQGIKKISTCSMGSASLLYNYCYLSFLIKLNGELRELIHYFEPIL